MVRTHSSSSQPQRGETETPTRSITETRAPPPPFPGLIQNLNIYLCTRVVTITIVNEDLTNPIVLEEDSIGLGRSGGAASRCVGNLGPVGADDGKVLVVPVVGEPVEREAIVGVDDVVCGAGGVYGRR